MASQIINAGLDDSGIMFRWASDSLDTISHLKADDIDFTPLLEADVFDGNPTAKHLNVIEIMRIALLGDKITIFDAASLKLSLGSRLGALVTWCGVRTRRLRRILYMIRTGFKGA